MKKRLETPKGLTLDTLAEFIEARIELVEARINQRFELVELRIDQRFGTVAERINNLETLHVALTARVSKVEQTTLDTLEEVAAINFALENDAKRYFDHDKRIARLEKASA